MSPSRKHKDTELGKSAVAPVAQGNSSLVQAIMELAFAAGGIFVCYLGYGILQEKVFHDKHGADDERFKFALFLVFCQCFVNGCVGLVNMLAVKQPPSTVPWTDFTKISLSYIGAMFASNYALSFVSYPTQALAKSCKMIPVMLMRIIINKKRYSWLEYACVFVITAGISVFMIFKVSNKAARDTSVFGLALLFISLALDGFTGPTQENIVAKHKPSTAQLMFYMNFISCCVLGVALVVTGELVPAVDFCRRYPGVLTVIFLLCVCASAGQKVILFTVVRFNSLTMTMITTTRKFFTILGSVILFNHHINGKQWCGVAMVFTGLAVNIWQKYQASKQRQLAEPKDGKSKKTID